MKTSEGDVVKEMQVVSDDSNSEDNEMDTSDEDMGIEWRSVWTQRGYVQCRGCRSAYENDSWIL